jgi:multidrug efflux system membrane fusion protein
MPRRFPSDRGASKGHEKAMTDPSGSNSEPTLLRSESFSAGLARRKRVLTIIAIVAIVLIGALIWYLGARPDSAKNQGSRGAADRSGRGDPSAAAIPVSVAAVRQGTFDVYLFALGTVTPINTVLVRSRVDGQVMRVAFEEGQMVNAGDLLAEIDPRPFEVQLTLASGQLARDQALLENARIDLDRYRTLLSQDSISRQQVDTQESLMRQYEAAVQSDQGGIANAKLQLTHARIVAPITGRVGLRQVDPGNIVRATDATGIVVITQLQPIGIVFPIPEDALPRVMKRLRAGDRIPIDAFDRAQKEKLGSGRLLTVDNQIDTATGTVKLKAEFPNTENALFANQFVNVRLPLETRQNATLVPSAAIQRGAAGTFVYVVKDDLSVAVTPVKLGPVQGEISTVESGVAAGAKVVIDGADRLRDGVKVELVARSGGGA